MLRMTNSIDPDQTAENGNSVDLDNTTKKLWQIVSSLIRLIRIAKSVHPDQTGENGKQSSPW